MSSREAFDTTYRIFHVATALQSHGGRPFYQSDSQLTLLQLPLKNYFQILLKKNADISQNHAKEGKSKLMSNIRKFTINQKSKGIHFKIKIDVYTYKELLRSRFGFAENK